MKPERFAAVTVLALLAFNPALAGQDSPQANLRTYAQNYKDMLLAYCLARAYKAEPKASDDASATSSVLLEWTEYDAEHSMEAIDGLIDRYLKRDYQNPLVEYKGIDFSLLKCLDMYHSKELDAQVKQFVPRPRRTPHQDAPRLE